MRSGDHLYFEAVIRSLPARRLRDEQRAQLAAFAERARSILGHIGFTVEEVAEGTKSLRAALTTTKDQCT